MKTPRRILLKLTGEVFLSPDDNTITTQHLKRLISQIKRLKDQFQFGIVIGGGNLFRGSEHGTHLGITPSIGHQIGMLATMINSLIIKDTCDQQQLPSRVLSSIECPSVGSLITNQTLQDALNNNDTIIFAGGTGNPFFTTDTNAVLRCLQINADQVWKGTNVDGLYSDNPRTNPHAQLIKQATYQQVLKSKYGIMDATAFALAQEHKKPIRIFNIFAKDALINIAHDTTIGSIIN